MRGALAVREPAAYTVQFLHSPATGAVQKLNTEHR
jgi:hypothetical protein